MAISRCEHHAPVGRTRSYVAAVHPAVVCGNRACKEPGLVWLEAEEKTSYDRGERTFHGPTYAFKVRTA
jgi:hypothetical protein